MDVIATMPGDPATCSWQAEPSMFIASLRNARPDDPLQCDYERKSNFQNDQGPTTHKIGHGDYSGSIKFVMGGT